VNPEDPESAQRIVTVDIDSEEHRSFVAGFQ